jgi:hypothetical protein
VQMVMKNPNTPVNSLDRSSRAMVGVGCVVELWKLTCTSGYYESKRGSEVSAFVWIFSIMERQVCIHGLAVAP